MTLPLRILQFITPAGFYGAERWVLAMARNANPDAVVHDLAVTREGTGQDLTLAELYPVDHGQQVHYVGMKSRFDFRAVARLCQIIREGNYDVIHSHGYKSDILGWLAARRTGIACVSTPHGFPGNAGWKMATYIKVGTHVLRYFDRVVPLSEELVEEIRRAGVPDNKIQFVRNGVDLTEIDETLVGLTARVRNKGREKTIGYIGQIIPRKQIGDLLTVFDRLYAHNTELRLQLVGDGTQRAELEIEAHGLASADAIDFSGFRSDRLELLAGFDLFVMTSTLEGIPRCLMEAMAVGVPVVAYDIPGVDQLVEHRRTGLLAPLGDKEALESCCRELLTDKAFAESLAANAREMVHERYSAARMASEYEMLFRMLVEGHQGVVAGKGQTD